MRNWYQILLIVVWTAMTMQAFGQQIENCFLNDFLPKYTTTPPYVDVPQITTPATIQVNVDATDTLTKVSKYIFGNAVAVWVGTNQNNPTLVSHLQKLSPTLIRFPGGSWSDIYFWNGNPGDLPDSIPNGQNNGVPIPLYAQFGAWYSLNVDQYYNMCQQVNTQGLITINYGYARYGLSARPAEQAAHYAAEWVRYDNGRTRFWEIGNENGGPWEAGYMIDTTTNQDGQPRIISGELYGKHFKIFADSMRAAAAENGFEIYIGGQILHYDGTGSWNVADTAWNEGFFREVGDTADFYVIHNYFNANSSTNARTILNYATEELTRNIDFINQDIAAKGAVPKPIAITEYNLGGDNTTANVSFIKGMQEVILFCDLIKFNFGMSARWLVANNETDGMFYYGSTGGGIPLWNPRPEFFYAHYTQKFMGDNMVTSTVPGSQTVLSYASRFASGHLAVILVNKGTTTYTVGLTPQNYSYGDRIYVYSLRGGTDNGDFSQMVYVNDASTTSPAWGPRMDSLEYIPARAYPTTGGILRFPLPARSVQFVLLEPGGDDVSDNGDGQVGQFILHQNYPNPFNPTTLIRYELPVVSRVNLKVFNVLGQEVANLVNGKVAAGKHEVEWDAADFPSGVYIYKLETESFISIKMMLLLK
jgi:hypothetical protein